jgi:hypothetical protein
LTKIFCRNRLAAVCTASRTCRRPTVTLIDYAATGPESMFTKADVDSTADILNTVRANALPAEKAV